jgi:hypothetical protein
MYSRIKVVYALAVSILSYGSEIRTLGKRIKMIGINQD